MWMAISFRVVVDIYHATSSILIFTRVSETGIVISMKINDLYEVTISATAFGGKGITHVDGMAVFVDQAIPGDTAMIKIVRKKKSYAEARIEKLIYSSPDRISPPCPYSGYCGGCKWQFVDYGCQLQYKRQHVIEALEHIGHITDVPVHSPIASELVWGYRNKIEFTCSGSRWRLPGEPRLPNDDGSDPAFGFHAPGVFHKVIDINACLLQPDIGNRILQTIRQQITRSDMPMYSPITHLGFWRFVMLRHSVAHDQWMVNIITASENRKTVQPLADMLRESYPEITSVINNITSRKAAISAGEYEICLSGDPEIHDSICGFDFDISANAFFQTNTRGAQTLYRTVKAYAGLTGRETVFDLYSGAGTIAICLSEAARQVVGFEIVDVAVSNAEKNCVKNGISNCTFYRGDIKERLSEISIIPDVMIVDPPRDGMHKTVVQQVLNIRPEKIVYVSCNPASLARDLEMMKDAYHILEIQPVDMFPHTFHIESVARLQKK